MSLAFRPSSISNLNEKPEIILKVKDQDFTIGKAIHYKFSSDENFCNQKTIDGKFYLAVSQQSVKSTTTKQCFKNVQEQRHA